MRKFIWISTGIIAALSLILGIILVARSSSVAETDVTTEDHKDRKETAEDFSNFTSFCDQNVPDWMKMISSAITTLDYFESNLDKLVTDVAVGTRIMEAQLNILLKNSPNVNATVLQDLETLQRKSKLVAESIIRHSVDESRKPDVTEYVLRRVNKNLQWIKSSSTWETPASKKWTTLLYNTTVQKADEVSMDTSFGEQSDGCIFGNFENCTIPDYCIDFFWKETRSGYKLTHQILFHYMVIQNDCFSGEAKTSYESQNLTDPTKFLGQLCHRVMAEAKLIESLNYPEDAQDLFVEQILVCSLAGYNDFLAQNWTNVILDWAADDGTLGCHITESKKLSKRSAKQRVKRWDNFFSLGDVTCSVHMGALILGVIGQQLRYFMEMCYDS